MKHSLFRITLPLTILVLAFAAWFGWMSYTQLKTQWIEAKVQQAMLASMESLAPGWPRIEMHNDLAKIMYYTPIIQDPTREFELTRHILELLNQDTSVPPIKVQRVSLSANYESSEDTLTCQAYVEFPLFAGFDKNIMVQGNLKIPHYPTPR